MRILYIICLVLPFTSLAQTSLDKIVINEELIDNVEVSDAVFTKDSRIIDFYKGVTVYSPILGSIVDKQVQSFKRKRDKGNILYFEFSNHLPDKTDDFLIDMLYRGGLNPSKKHPATYKIYDNIIILYVFKQDSELKQQLETFVDLNIQIDIDL